MIQQIKMPSAGQTTDEARIASIKVKAGDKVKRGDILVEAETDKAVLPVESFAAGLVLDVLVAEGDDVHAGDVLVAVGSEEDQKSYVRGGAPAPAAPAAPIPAPSAQAEAPDEEEYLPIVKGAAPVPRPAATAPAPEAKWPAMPNAKMLARGLGVDLSGLAPANGVMLTRKDVRAAQASARPAQEAARSGSEYEVLPMTKTREVIGRRMLESVQNIPAWQCTVNVDMEACMGLKRDYQEKRGIKLSYNDIMAKAIAVAARKFPLVNARCEEGEVRVYKHTNVGLAVGLDGALLVPVVKEIDVMGLEEIADKYRQVVKKARDSKLAPSDMGCGSITISNLGMFDVDQFIAIVNPPESCILAVGRIAVQPVWDGRQFQPVHMMSVTGSFDHRIIDGAYGAQFLRELKLLMEHPTLLLG